MENINEFYDEFNDLKNLELDFLSSRKGSMQLKSPTKISSGKHSKGDIEVP